MSKTSSRLKRLLRNKKLRQWITIEIVAIMTVAAFLLPGGQDLHVYYLPQARGCLECGLNPWHTSWIIAPMRLAPEIFAWSVWTLFTATSLVWASRRLKTESVFLLLTFPVMGLIWLGQTDAIVVIGITLALTSPSPYLRGLGLVLMTVKPHLGGIAILVLLWHEEERLKTLIIPALVLVATILVWGIDWPLRWVEARPEDLGLPVWGQATLLFPFSLVAFLSIFLVEGKRNRVLAALLASAISVPWFGVYSYVVFLVLMTPWWAVPLSYVWFAAYPWLENRAMQFAWILPLTLLITLIWPPLTERWPALAALRFPWQKRDQIELALESNPKDDRTSPAG
jgi:hypothetical protein